MTSKNNPWPLDGLYRISYANYQIEFANATIYSYICMCRKKRNLLPALEVFHLIFITMSWLICWDILALMRLKKEKHLVQELNL